MKTKSLLMACALALAASTAHAATLAVLPAPYAPTNPVLDINFNTPGTPYSLDGQIAILSASIPNIAAMPGGPAGNFAVVPYPGASGTGTIMFGPVAGGLHSIRVFGFTIGSPDSYNHFDILNELGVSFLSFGVNDLLALGGLDQFENLNVAVILADNETIGGMSGSATQAAAEFKGLAGGVPEPSTWAMMIAGFGLVGASLRRRRAATTFA